jgi:hypothetical protein
MVVGSSRSGRTIYIHTTRTDDFGHTHNSHTCRNDDDAVISRPSSHFCSRESCGYMTRVRPGSESRSRGMPMGDTFNSSFWLVDNRPIFPHLTDACTQRARTLLRVSGLMSRSTAPQRA